LIAERTKALGLVMALEFNPSLTPRWILQWVELLGVRWGDPAALPCPGVQPMVEQCPLAKSPEPPQGCAYVCVYKYIIYYREKWNTIYI